MIMLKEVFNNVKEKFSTGYGKRILVYKKNIMVHTYILQIMKFDWKMKLGLNKRLKFLKFVDTLVK